MYKSCKTQILKEDGVFLNGKWFCSQQHAEIDPDVQKVNFIQEKLKTKSQIKVKDKAQSDEEEYEIDL